MDTTSTHPGRCTDPLRPARPAVVRWPVDAGLRDDLARQGVPCLLVVPRGAPIPTVGLGEDWVRDTADEREIAVRLRQLAALGRPAGEAVPPVLPPTLRPSALRLAAVLSSPPGRLVPTAELEGADGSRLPLDELLAELRDALEPGGWSIEAVGTTGYVLVRSDVP